MNRICSNLYCPLGVVGSLCHRMISACKTREEIEELSITGQTLLSAIADSPKPTVAAIMGSCLGGGLEVCTD